MANEFDPADRLQELKYENALYKVLAALGALVEKHQLSPKKGLKVDLAVLLPWNEYSDRKRFKAQLEEMLKGYRFRGESLKVKLGRCLIRPEGAGLAATRIRKQGLDWFRQRRLGVLMFGHRNVTALYFELGELKSGSSPLIGFSWMLDSVIERTSGLDRDRLVQAIFRGINSAQSQIYQVTPAKYDWKANISVRHAYTLHPQWEKLEAIQALANAKNPSLRAEEVKDLARAMGRATAEYWDKLSLWLRKALPQSLDEVMISGGAAYFLQPELEQYFNCEANLLPTEKGSLSEVRTGSYHPRHANQPFAPIIWGAGIDREVEKLLKLTVSQSRSQGLRYRLIDVFGLFDYLIESEEKGEPKQTA
jgi:hypothetical protein